VLNPAAASDSADVVAVASRDAARAQAYAREHGIERAYGSYSKLLADPGVEAVYISLPNSMHVEWTLRALEAGKHVLCEKPFDRHAEAVARCFDTAEAAGLVLMEAFMYRHHPQTKRLSELLSEGAIGELRLVRAIFDAPMSDPADFRFDPELGDGGAMMDVGCYCVSGIRLVAGEPEVVSGEQVLGATGVDLRFAGWLRFPGDVLATFDCGFLLPYRQRLEAVGTEGSLLVAMPWECSDPHVELRRGENEPERIDVEDVDRYRAQLENFCAAVRGTEPPLLGRDDAVGQARTIEALYDSAERDASVRLT
jgi:predicted dehydrogenase